MCGAVRPACAPRRRTAWLPTRQPRPAAVRTAAQGSSAPSAADWQRQYGAAAPDHPPAIGPAPVQLLTTLITVTGDLIALAAAVTNLAAVLAQRRPRASRGRQRPPELPYPAHRAIQPQGDNGPLSRT
jgi:hypothetical protein